MMTLHEATVAERFDALRDRFKTEVADDDPRLLAIVERLSPLAGRVLLDLGCGKGRFARSLREQGARVVGLDVSSGMLAQADDIDRVRASARRLPFAAASFDGALAVEVFEHLAPQSLDHVCREVLRVLRPGGTFVVIDKNACSWNARRPWLPSLAVKWIDERRGRWMYSPRDAVRERWFAPWELKRRLGRWFPEVRVWHLLSRSEASRFPFRWVPLARLLVLWSARAPGGSA
jgi:2-polyprenyl-6-hydroxyphenyl methylase/3-demethylubiquinone-9 3-methyltransferase